MDGGQNPRFKSENILNLELDMPERTTYDYEGPGMNGRVQAALNAAFSSESEMLYVASDDGAMGNVMLFATVPLHSSLPTTPCQDALFSPFFFGYR